MKISEAEDQQWRVEVFFDGECPLCLREIKMLQWLDRSGRIRFTDIAAPEFAPADYGMSMTEFMDEINGRLPSGAWIRGFDGRLVIVQFRPSC